MPTPESIVDALKGTELAQRHEEYGRISDNEFFLIKKFIDLLASVDKSDLDQLRIRVAQTLIRANEGDAGSTMVIKNLVEVVRVFLPFET